MTPQMLAVLTGFLHRVARKILGMMARQHDGSWVYPPIEEALEAALFLVEEYVRRRRNRMGWYMATARCRC